MTGEALNGHLGTAVTIDVCLPCRMFWFDGRESLQLAPAATLKLFRIIGTENDGARAVTGPGVGEAALAAAARGFDRGDRLREGGLVPVDGGDEGAFGGDQAGDRGADPAAARTHDDDSATRERELRHAATLTQMRCATSGRRTQPLPRPPAVRWRRIRPCSRNRPKT